MLKPNTDPRDSSISVPQSPFTLTTPSPTLSLSHAHTSVLTHILPKYPSHPKYARTPLYISPTLLPYPAATLKRIRSFHHVDTHLIKHRLQTHTHTTTNEVYRSRSRFRSRSVILCLRFFKHNLTSIIQWRCYDLSSSTCSPCASGVVWVEIQ